MIRYIDRMGLLIDRPHFPVATTHHQFPVEPRLVRLLAKRHD